MPGFTPFEAFTGGLVEVAGGLRASGGFSNPNFLGLYMAPAAVFALGLLAAERRRVKVVLVPLVILLFACVAFSYSRNAFVGSMAGIVVLVAFKSRVAALPWSSHSRPGRRPCTRPSLRPGRVRH